MKLTGGWGIFDEMETKTNFGRLLRIIRPIGLSLMILYSPFLYYETLESEE
jgi:hypothetical protein